MYQRTQDMTRAIATPEEKLPLAVPMAFMGILLLLICVWLAPVPGQQMAVLASPFAPPSTSARIAATAEADILARSRWPALLVVSDSDPHAVARLYAAGAWLVINPTVLAGCFHKEA